MKLKPLEDFEGIELELKPDPESLSIVIK